MFTLSRRRVAWADGMSLKHGQQGPVLVHTMTDNNSQADVPIQALFLRCHMPPASPSRQHQTIRWCVSTSVRNLHSTLQCISVTCYTIIYSGRVRHQDICVDALRLQCLKTPIDSCVLENQNEWKIWWSNFWLLFNIPIRHHDAYWLFVLLCTL